MPKAKKKRGLEELIEKITRDFKTVLHFRDKEAKELILLRGRVTKLASEIANLSAFGQTVPKQQYKALETAIKQRDEAEAKVAEIEQGKFFEQAFEWRLEFPEVLDAEGRYTGFDAIIGNPPYISIQDLKAINPGYINYYKKNFIGASLGNFDVYILFIELSTRIVKKNGISTYILPTKFFTTDYGKPIRGFLTSENLVRNIVDFGHDLVFDMASTYTCILAFGKSNETSFNYSKSKASERDLNCLAISKIPQKELSDSSWTFSGNDIKPLNISAQVKRLIDIPCRISRGSSTGNDKIFIIEIKEGEYFNGYGEKVDVEDDILLNPIFATDFTRYHFKNKNDKRLIFPYRRTGDYELMQEDFLLHNYPKCYSYLQSHRPKLLERKQSGPWYSYSAARNLRLHAHSNILIPLLANQGLYSLTPKSFLNNEYTLMAGGGFSITIEIGDYSPELLLGILNSKLLFKILYNQSNKFRGGYITCTKQYFENLPIPIAIDESVMLQIESLVLQIISLLNENPLTDTSALEQEIDALVNAAYGLTAEEVGMLEQHSG